MVKVLVTTASFGSGIHSTWVDQQSSKYDITLNRVSDETDSARPLAMHPRLRAKMPRMLPWEEHPGYDYYIWMDACFSLRYSTAIEKMVDYCRDTDACFFRHSGRSSVESEAQFVLSLLDEGNQYILDRYEEELIFEQLEHYKKDKDWNDNFLIETGTFIFSKNIVENREYNLMKEWFYHNCLWSIQDQLSLPYLLHKFKTKYKFFERNVFSNDYTYYS
tara:strand:- start:1824 stop:2480 length:657 start_codon:yes stop_codon:yes gene_type:complete